MAIFAPKGIFEMWRAIHEHGTKGEGRFWPKQSKEIWCNSRYWGFHVSLFIFAFFYPKVQKAHENKPSWSKLKKIGRLEVRLRRSLEFRCFWRAVFCKGDLHNQVFTWPGWIQDKSIIIKCLVKLSRCEKCKQTEICPVQLSCGVIIPQNHRCLSHNPVSCSWIFIFLLRKFIG